MRIFLSIEPPAEIIHTLDQITNTLAESYRKEPISWIPPNQLHLTALFLGEVNEDLLPKIKLLGEDVIKKFPLFFVELTNFLIIRKSSFPKIIALQAYEQSGIFQELNATLYFNFKKILTNVENKNFKPHLTIGRIRGKKYTKKINLGHFDKIIFPVKTVQLVKSTLSAIGPTYTILDSFKLQNEGK